MAAKRPATNQMEAILGDAHPVDRSKWHKIQDSHCWLCHRNNTTVNCSTCIRSYHRDCLGLRSLASTSYECEICIRLNLANSSTIVKYGSVEYLNQLLVFTAKRLLNDLEVSEFRNNRKIPKTIILIPCMSCRCSSNDSIKVITKTVRRKSMTEALRIICIWIVLLSRHTIPNIAQQLIL